MRFIIATATAFVLMAGIALGFIVSKGLDRSASAAPPPPQSRLIELGTQTVLVGGGLQYQSGFVDISDCDQATIMAISPDGIGPLALVWVASPDGTNAVHVEGKAERSDDIDGVPTTSVEGIDVVFPFIRVESAAGGPIGETVDITVWLWCEP